MFSFLGLTTDTIDCMHSEDLRQAEEVFAAEAEFRTPYRPRKSCYNASRSKAPVLQVLLCS